MSGVETFSQEMVQMTDLKEQRKMPLHSGALHSDLALR
jgi:hypothetical protein